MEAQEEAGPPARSVANPLNDDGGVAPRPPVRRGAGEGGVRDLAHR